MNENKGYELRKSEIPMEYLDDCVKEIRQAIIKQQQESMQQTADHYISSILAFNHATHTAIRCVPIRFRHGVKQRMSHALTANMALEKVIINDWLKDKPELVTVYEDLSAFYTDVLAEVAKSENRAQVLALIKAFNNGEVRIENDVIGEK